MRCYHKGDGVKRTPPHKVVRRRHEKGRIWGSSLHIEKLVNAKVDLTKSSFNEILSSLNLSIANPIKTSVESIFFDLR